MGSGFIGLHGGRQMFSPVDFLADWLWWQVLPLVFLLWNLFVALERDSVETEETLPVDHTPTIKSVRAY